MFKGVNVILQKFNTSTMYSTELLLRIKVSKGFVLQVKDKLLRQKIISRMAQRLPYHIEFFIVNGVIQSSTTKFFLEEGDGVLFLT